MFTVSQYVTMYRLLDQFQAARLGMLGTGATEKQHFTTTPNLLLPRLVKDDDREI